MSAMTSLASITENATLVVASVPRLSLRSKARHISQYQDHSWATLRHGREIPAAGSFNSTRPLPPGLPTCFFRRPAARKQAMTDNKSIPYSSKASSGSTTASSVSGFTYKLAAAYSGKSNQFDPNAHYFSFDSSSSTTWHAGKEVDQGQMVRKGKNRIPSGQDACFITTVGHTEAVAFGIADGVGGWQLQGIDSADFAHGICRYMQDAARQYQPSAPSMSPLDLLKLGYDRVCSDKSIQGGGSTACIAVADELGSLKVANLGDSGFMQLRLNKVHHYSDPQTHAFNTPYQLSSIPPKILAQIEEFGGGAPFSDMPDDASVTSHDIQHGDVLVFGTDGVWDNLSSQDLLSIVSDRMTDAHAWEDTGAGTDVSGLLPHLTQERRRDESSWKPLHSLLATEIVQSAKEAGMNSKRDGPFAKAFQRAYPEEPYSGGKPDDIAVIVAIAIDPTFEPSRHVTKGVKSKL